MKNFCKICNSFRGGEISNSDAPDDWCNGCNHTLDTTVHGCVFTVLALVFAVIMALITS